MKHEEPSVEEKVMDVARPGQRTANLAEELVDKKVRLTHNITPPALTLWENEYHMTCVEW